MKVFKVVMKCLVVVLLTVIALASWKNEIVDYVVINYSWGELGSLAVNKEIGDWIMLGYEPDTYVCANGVQGGCLLMVKKGWVWSSKKQMKAKHGLYKKYVEKAMELKLE